MPNVAFWSPKKRRLLHRQGNDQTASGEDGSRCICIQCSRFRNGEPPSGTSSNSTQTHPKQPLAQHEPPPEHAPKPDKNAAPRHHGRRFRNGTPPSEQASKPRKCIQSSRLRNSKPPSEHAPKPDKNQTKTQRHTAHEKCLTSLSEALKKQDYYTAKATTRLHLEKMGPDASASNVAASATANHPRNKLQQHANASKAAASATVNHHLITPQNRTKTRQKRSTTPPTKNA